MDDFSDFQCGPYRTAYSAEGHNEVIRLSSAPSELIDADCQVDNVYHNFL